MSPNYCARAVLSIHVQICLYFRFPWCAGSNHSTCTPRGRLFRESTLPNPFSLVRPSSKSPILKTSQLYTPLAAKDINSPSNQTVDGNLISQASASPRRSKTPLRDASEDPSRLSLNVPAKRASLSPAPPQDSLKPPPSPRVVRSRRTVSPDGPTAKPQRIAPLAPEEVAALPQAATPQGDVHISDTQPKVVHLPPKDVQERRLQETREAQERKAQREQREDKLAVPVSGQPDDTTSSPSSTVANSMNTPHAPQISPDTSPDKDSSKNASPSVKRIGPPTRLRPSAVEERIENDAQTPEAQLRQEDEQAIRQARDSDHLRARSEKGDDLSAQKSLVAESEKVVEEIVAADKADVDAVSTPSPVDVVLNGDSSQESTAGSSKEVVAKPAKSKHEVSKHPTPPPDVEMADVNVGPLPSTAAAATVSTPRLQSKPSARGEGMTIKVPQAGTKRKHSETFDESPGTALLPALPINGTLTPKSNAQAGQSPDRLSRRRSRRSSTVVFPKKERPATPNQLTLYAADYAALKGASLDDRKDYLQSLFQYQAHNPPRAVPLKELLSSANKTLTTSNLFSSSREILDYQILRRIYQLQNANRWSLRQLEKAAEPPLQITFIDHLMSQMKSMRTDFRQERRWKIASARNLARNCAEWVASSPEKRLSLQVRVKKWPAERPLTGEPQPGIGNSVGTTDSPAPDITPSQGNEAENDSTFESFISPLDVLINPNPASLFNLGFDDVILHLDHTSAYDSVIQELPEYDPISKLHPADSYVSSATPPEPAVLPVSKMVTGKLLSQATGPPRRRSRYDYDEEEQQLGTPRRQISEPSMSMPSTPGRRFNRDELPPEESEVALFKAENKHIRDRLYFSQTFRPPSEFSMPPTSFFESRMSSQWFWEEDQRLRVLVKEYSFNWSLISASLSQPSLFAAGADRRTPWECFERWMQLEGLPSEMGKTQYFRTYLARIEAAQNVIKNQHQAAQEQMAQQSQPTNNPALSAALRRRTSQPIRVEKKKANRYLAIIDGMRKLARKRESAAHKQQEGTKRKHTLLTEANVNSPSCQSRCPQESTRGNHCQSKRSHPSGIQPSEVRARD